MDEEKTVTGMVVDIVSAFVVKNSLPAAELPALILSVHGTLEQLGKVDVAVPDIKTPTVSIKKSIGTDYLICLEDGRQFKSLKRHLSTKYGLTPDAYRAKWGLPKDYPMVAPTYAASRSALAKQMGLGAAGRKPATPKGRKA
ncbi:MucR family transcriptional regulator [Asticcacaulis machinosus]|uniref:MucR family transcriptional regulator n=1 Tax=Asticcacaulis machinosus TaxID=2984211 RepID=A0ABT5HIZ1_9CAUL|nr:MucR family transcriptional regulator [Asticcacaulis machinosus]MDC7675564.1 MucR family transcriptional regulator [Asticcacaulis machinosus]